MLPRTYCVTLLAILCLLTAAQAAFGQTKPRLGILPFSGGGEGDGETIATLFSFQADIQKAFTIVPRTSAVNDLIAEQDFQMTGYTDSDTIARLGRLLNADFVVSGHIRKLGNSNLVIVTFVHVETFEQMAGDYRQYKTIEEVRDLLPAIAQNMIAAAGRDTSKLPKLAIAPFNIVKGVNEQDAEALAEILSVEITKTGKFAVLPRTSAMKSAMQELEYQMDGFTEEESAKALGKAINADYVMSAAVQSLGNINMFTAQILHVQDGRQLTGASRDYTVIEDGFKVMPDLALVLTDPDEYEKRQAQIQQQEADKIAALEAKRLAEEKARRARANRYWSIGASAGSSFADPLLIGTVYGTLAPFQYSFLELGCDIGFLTRLKGAGYYSVYPYARYALFIPFTKTASASIGAGGGYMLANYQLDDIQISKSMFTADFSAGLTLKMFRIAYSLRSDFSSVSHKVSVGFSYRFGAGEEQK